MKTMKEEATMHRNYRKVAGDIAGVYDNRQLGVNKMGADPKGWTAKMRDAGVPRDLLLDWVKEATEKGQRCDCPLSSDHLVKERFDEWKGNLVPERRQH